MPGLLDPNYLATLDQPTLLGMRKRARTQAEQDQLAGYEHRAYARETVRDNPAMALSLLVATPAYQLAKIFGATNSRSAPSWGQMGQGLLGIYEGLK